MSHKGESGQLNVTKKGWSIKCQKQGWSIKCHIKEKEWSIKCHRTRRGGQLNVT